MAQKFKLGSKEWLDALHKIFQDLVRVNGTPGQAFSFCQILHNAPDGLVGGKAGQAAFHFLVHGKTVEVHEGEMQADITVTADYQEILPDARRVFTPEILAKQRTGEIPMPELELTGDVTKMPGYMRELHNRAAAITA
jgi:hypothetical protein